ncbi:Glutathione S-transferase C-terminal [Trinorchestia longiramus]|nr:Glutathione S-transferase C-terminal [Trinorchestia longiramus]
MAPEPVLGYWSIRGLAQFLRYTLVHAGVKYEDKMYDIGPGPEFSRAQWTSEKESLGLEFPNLPYYIEGDVKITESAAIAKYLGRKHGLVGSTEAEIIKLDMAEGIIQDIARSIVMLCYDSEFESKKAAFVDSSNAQLTKLSKLVGNNKYILGDKITWIDFLLLETLDRFVELIPGCLNAHANLQDFQKRILDLPNIKKYRDSPCFQKIKARYNGPFAKFGSGR